MKSKKETTSGQKLAADIKAFNNIKSLQKMKEETIDKLNSIEHIFRFGECEDLKLSGEKGFADLSGQSEDIGVFLIKHYTERYNSICIELKWQLRDLNR